MSKSYEEVKMEETPHEQFYNITTYQELMEMIQSSGGVIYSDRIVMSNPSNEKSLTQYECRVRIGDEIVHVYAHVGDMLTQSGHPVAFSMSVYHVQNSSIN